MIDNNAKPHDFEGWQKNVEIEVKDERTLFSILGQIDNPCNLDSTLIASVETAMRKKIYRLSRDEVRLLISQQIGLEFVVPVAIDYLENDLFVNNEPYLGQLLEVVAELPLVFWESNLALNNRMADIKFDVLGFSETLETIVEKLGKIDFIW